MGGAAFNFAGSRQITTRSKSTLVTADRTVDPTATIAKILMSSWTESKKFAVHSSDRGVGQRLICFVASLDTCVKDSLIFVVPSQDCRHVLNVLLDLGCNIFSIKAWKLNISICNGLARIIEIAQQIGYVWKTSLMQLGRDVRFFPMLFRSTQPKVQCGGFNGSFEAVEAVERKVVPVRVLRPSNKDPLQVPTRKLQLA